MKKKFTILLIFLSLIALALRGEYVPYTSLHPGQTRFSSKNVEQKIEEAIRKGDLVCDGATGRFRGKYGSGKSMFPEENSLPVILSPVGWVLVDGHHHTLASIQSGVDLVPIKMVADYSGLEEGEFWDRAERDGWVFLRDLDGKKTVPPKDFNLLDDDQNRYFAAITARKTGPDGDIANSSGAEYPLWIKVGKDIPFIEFHISDALREGGINYAYKMGDHPSIDFVEHARQVLVEANIPGLRVVPTRQHYTDISCQGRGVRSQPRVKEPKATERGVCKVSIWSPRGAKEC